MLAPQARREVRRRQGREGSPLVRAMRAIQMRLLRLPKPQVKRGAVPELSPARSVAPRQSAVDLRAPRAARGRGTPCSPARGSRRRRGARATSAAGLDSADRDHAELGGNGGAHEAQHLERARARAARRRARRRPRPRRRAGSVRSPSRESVVLVAMMPASPSSTASSAMRAHLVVGEVGGDLHEQRRRARGIRAPRRAAGASVSSSCRPRRPGRVRRADVDHEVVGERGEQPRALAGSRRSRRRRRRRGSCRC